MSTQAAHAAPPRPRPVPGHLRSLVFRGLRSLLDVRIELASRLTVLVGANGSGKSSVLDGAHYLCQTLLPVGASDASLDGRIAEIFSEGDEFAQLVTRGTGVTGASLGMVTTQGSVWLRGTLQDYFELAVGELDALADAEEWRATDSVTSEELLPGLRRLEGHPRTTGIGPCVRLRLDARRAKKPSYSEDEEPRVGYDGSNLATTLAWLGNNARDARDAIESDLARVVPGVRAIKVPRIKITRTEEEYLRIDDEIVPRHRKRELVADTVEVEFAEAGFLPISQLSEGTVLALALLTVLHSPACPNLVLLDDIEQALHPDAQYELVRVLRRVLEEKPHVQVIATTHSPYLLDSLDPAEVQVLALDEHGHTHAKRFDEHPEAQKLIRSLHLSEMWSGLGEDWVLGR